MFFDGASRSPMGARKGDAPDNVVGIGILLISSDKALICYSFSLTTGFSNNTVEYEAVITRLELAL